MAATATAEQLFRDGVARDEIVADLERQLGEPQMAVAIADFVISQAAVVPRRINPERFSGLYFALVATLCLGFFLQGVRWVETWIPTGALPLTPAQVALISFAVFVQWCLIKLAWKTMRGALVGITDALNLASYPTRFHRPLITNSDQDRVRKQRLLNLIRDCRHRMLAGERARSLARELSEIELTKAAAWLIVAQAKIGSWMQSSLPPYASRSRAHTIFASIVIGGLIGIWSLQPSLKSPGQVMSMLAWLVTLAFESMRLPAPIRQPEQP